MSKDLIRKALELGVNGLVDKGFSGKFRGGGLAYKTCPNNIVFKPAPGTCFR